MAARTVTIFDSADESPPAPLAEEIRREWATEAVVIDHQGVIRYKWTGDPRDPQLDTAVQE
jgi:hypothetical protein